MKGLLIVAAATILALPFAAVAATEPKTSSTVKIVLPGDLNYGYKAGPGQQVAQTYCLTCHSSAYVAMQPPMDAAHWTKTVTKMRKQYGMQISNADAVKIAQYLGSEYGRLSRK